MSQISNKTLAIFMGYQVWETERGNFMANVNGVSDHVNSILPFDKDWNLLFKVIGKIESLGYVVTLSKRQCQIYYAKSWEMIIDADFYDTFIENAFDGIVAFVHWYNQRPSSWPPDFKLPSKSADKKDEVIESLVEDLFHMSDDEANKIKQQYKNKYIFLTEDDLKYL